MPAASPLLLILTCSLLLAAVHVLAGRLRFLEGVPRNRWLSVGSGVSVAYVFVHLLPELSEEQEVFAEISSGAVLAYLEYHVYLLALAGLVIFYGLEQAAQRSRRGKSSESATTPSVFWLHMASFSAYNALIGYLLVHREEQSATGLLLYTAAMALHFVVNDFGLRTHHKHQYHHVGRWVLAAAALAGTGLGLATKIHEAAVAALFAFLAGAIVLNVLKEELPEERQSRFWAFALGGAAYTALLLISF